MFGLMEAGERKLPTVGQADGVEPGTLDGSHFMTTVFLDFGQGYTPAGLDISVGGFRNIDGTNTGSSLVGRSGLTSTDILNFQPLNYHYDHSGFFDVTDTSLLANHVLTVANRALQPV